MATADDMASIAFPAMGTGFLQFPASLVARAMFDEVKAFSAANQRTSISSIFFVIYHTDTDTLNVSANFMYFSCFILLCQYFTFAECC